MDHRNTTRRDFLNKTTTTAAAGSTLVGVHVETSAAKSLSPNQVLNVAAIGVGNRGAVNIAEMKSENMVALCDVDEHFLDRMSARYPEAKTYHDLRELLTQENLDAVVISTPDHTHFYPAMVAMQRGLHVYVEKPLAHNVSEVCALKQLAREKKVVTQMGNQHHSSVGYRTCVEYLQAGVIGEVSEVHSWSNRPLWPQGIARPATKMKTPRGFHWPLWRGPAPRRPYHEVYHPFKWRGWYDFGTGALGDMGPHLLDPVFWAFALTTPSTIEAESSAVGGETFPAASIVRFEFPATDKRPALKLTWYDGGNHPPISVTGVRKPPKNGTMLIGSKARLFVPELGGQPIVLPHQRGEKIPLPKPFLAVSPGQQRQWIQACKGEGVTDCNFDYSSSLTATCLLGNIAVRTGERLTWNPEKDEFEDNQRANQMLSREVRSEWAT